MPVKEEWRVADQFLLPLDAHGWARTGIPLSKRANTRVVPERRRASDFTETVGPSVRKPSRFNVLSMAETYKEAGELEVKAAAVAARAAEAVAQAQRLGMKVDGLLVAAPDDDEDDGQF